MATLGLIGSLESGRCPARALRDPTPLQPARSADGPQRQRWPGSPASA